MKVWLLTFTICKYYFKMGHRHKYKTKLRTTAAAAAAAKSLQSCPTLCDPIDGSPPGSPVPGIHQARILEWVAISFSNAWKWKVKVKSLSHVWLLATPWTAAHQGPPSMRFSRQEYWSGVPLPSLTQVPRFLKIIIFHTWVKKKCILSYLSFTILLMHLQNRVYSTVAVLLI